MNQFKKKLVVSQKETKHSNKKEKKTYYIMYDKEKNKIGKINADNEKLQNNWLKGVSVFVITEDGNLILEKRSKDTKLTPDQIDLCSGHRDNKEKGKQTAYRELKEELGIKPKQVLKLKKMNSEVPLVFKGNRKFFIQFYAGIVEKRKLKLQKEEVDETQEVSLEEGFDLIRSGKTKFPYEGRKEEFEQIFEAIRDFLKQQKVKEQDEEKYL